MKARQLTTRCTGPRRSRGGKVPRCSFARSPSQKRPGSGERGVRHSQNSMRKLALLALFAMLALTSCKNTPQPYKGDGILTDYGEDNPTCHYVIDLGSIDLSKTSVYSYEINGPPRAWFFIGIDFAAQSREEDPDKIPLDGEIGLFLLKLGGPYLIALDKPLSKATRDVTYRNWGWSMHCFFDGGCDERPLLDFVWGSSFEAYPGAQYRLRLAVKKPCSSKYPARLVLKSTGWK